MCSINVRGDAVIGFEETLRQLAEGGELTLFPHDGFWMGMGTYRDWLDLNNRWEQQNAPWKIWSD